MIHVAERKTLYNLLGVPDSAGKLEIKTAYRALAKTCHPDISDDVDAEEKFKALQRAYNILSDSETRCDYDAELRMLAAAKLEPDAMDIVFGHYDSLDPAPKRAKKRRDPKRPRAKVYEEEIPDGYLGDETAGGIFPKGEDISE